MHEMKREDFRGRIIKDEPNYCITVKFRTVSERLKRCTFDSKRFIVRYARPSLCFPLQLENCVIIVHYYCFRTLQRGNIRMRAPLLCLSKKQEVQRTILQLVN